MNDSELHKILEDLTPEEEYIVKSINSSHKKNLTNKKIMSILYPVLLWNEKEGTPVLSGESILPSDENISISKHHRFIPIPAHQHDFIELFYVYSGSCIQTINGKNVVLKKGDMCILDTNVIHSIEATSKDDIIINFLMRKNYFDTSFLSRLSSNDLFSTFLVHAIYQSKDYNNFIIFRNNSEQKLHQLVSSLLCEYFHPSICSKEIIDCYIILIFSELLQIYHHQTPELQILDHTINTKNISKILEYIEKNYTTATLTKTAKNFNYHPNYLSTLLKKVTGKSFKEIIHEQKLKKACTLLKNTDMTVEDISFEVGYNNFSFFYKKFKNAFGLTPLKFRKKNQ